MKYAYPAIFTKEKAGISIRFPDIDGCFSSAETLAIPAWLNTMAERAGVNFSMILQTALKRELNIQ